MSARWKVISFLTYSRLFSVLSFYVVGKYILLFHIIYGYYFMLNMSFLH